MDNCIFNKSDTVEARAKVNLALDITGTKGDMHLIDTVIVPIDLCDTITLTPSDILEVEYSDGRSYTGDTAIKAAKLISQEYRTPAVNINIIKRIPEGMGLGGSSADAAGVARGMQKLFNLPPITNEILLKVGSDVPAMYQDSAVRVKGIGEQVSCINLNKYYGILLMPNCTISTAEAYRLYDKIGGEKADIDGFLEGVSPAANSLQKAALTLEPQLITLIDILNKSGLQEVVMTGSGSGFIGFTQCPTLYKKAKDNLESLSLDGKGIKMLGFETNNTERLCQKTN